MRSALVVLLSAIGLFGCKKRETSSTPAESSGSPKKAAVSSNPQPADLAALRDEVFKQVEIFKGYPEYTPRDGEVVAKLLDPSFEFAFYVNGTDPSKRAAVVEHVATSYYNALVREEAGIAAIEKLLTDRYMKPVIAREGDRVRVDLGVIAGKPYRFRGGISVASPYGENGTHGLIASEVVRNLELGIAAHPDAKTYQVEVAIPGRWRTKDGYTYVYSRAEDRVRLYIEDIASHFYRSDALAGNLQAFRAATERVPMDRPPIRAAELRRKLR